MTDREAIVSAAVSYIGCKESNNSHRKIIDIYNKGASYGISYDTAWCAAFVSAMAIQCKLTDIIPVTASCNDMISKFKNRGAWNEDDAYVPKPGDFIFYDWDDSGYGNNKSEADHVGLVEKVSGNTISVIEGNTGNAVKRLQRTVNGKNIRGYGVPKYKDTGGYSGGSVFGDLSVSTYDPEVGAGYQPSTDDVLAFNNNNIEDSEFVKLKNVAGVFGLPYQFLPSADVRLDGSSKLENIGYEYGEKIVEKIPLLFMAPGKANFMTKYSNKNKQNILEKLITLGAGQDNKTQLSDLLDSDGRYYTFEYDTVRYYKFVNPMCRIAARYLNIHNITLEGSRLDNFNWENYTKSGIKTIGDFGSYTSIPFYVDTDTSISESFGNSTTQSMLASTVNSASDMAKELNFLLGYGAGGKSADAFLEDTNIAQSVQNVTDMASRLLGAGGFFSNLGNHLVTVASGGKLVFPEIWSDSTFSRSFNVKFKFVSPDASKLSVYLNVLVPLFHLIGLVAPQMPENNPNGYTNPFLIRAIYKGFFNIDMGIITDMSVTKGAECQWTPEGVPTSIEVDIGIKDLYNAMSITSINSTNSYKYDTMNNTALMDYIANLCGINIYKPEITRIIDMWYTNNFENRITDFFEVDIWGGIQQRIQNTIVGIFR